MPSTKRIEIGTHVGARRGPTLDLKDGRQRRQRDMKYGTVKEAKGDAVWLMEWDDCSGVAQLKSSQLKIAPASAGVDPLEA